MRRPIGVTLTTLQAEGAARARAILDRYGGVVVADSVGMGKTYLALQLIAEQVQTDPCGPVLVVVPATLRHKWRQALRSTGHEPYSPGRAASEHEHGVLLTSHALLHRTATNRAALIVVDEAHQFRNPRTARYRALARTSVGARVLLLTATPINNRAADLYWLLRLFLGDGALADAGVPDLRTALRRDDHAELARRVIARLVVRRTRADLSAGGAAHATLRFPRQHAPRPVRYTMPVVHMKNAEAIARLRLSAFDVDRSPDRGNTGHATSSAPATAALVRIGLLKRLESSTHAFRASVTRLLRFLDAFEDAVRCGGHLRPRDTRTGDPLQLSLTGLLARPLPRGCNAARLLDEVQADRSTLERMRVDAQIDTADTKAEALHALLRALGDEPRVVFTGFADTASALFHALPRTGVAMLHGGGAAIASGPLPRRAVLERFAPRAHNAPAPPQHERIHTLVATDVLAEGLDLQDAQHCISYDLPWNPVRLMQRAGRIDRLGSLHDDVYIWYFEPDAELERLLGLMRRLGAKIHSIARTVGAEHGAVGAASDGALGGFSGPPRASAPGAADYATLRALVEEPNQRSQTVLAACTRTALPDAMLLLAWQTERTAWVDGFTIRDDTIDPLDHADVIRLLVRLHPADTSPPADRQRARAAVSRALATLRTTASRTATPDSATRRTAEVLRRAITAHPGGAGPALCRRADRILHQLRAGLSAGAARHLARTIRDAGRLPAAELCSALEGVVGPCGKRAAARRPRLSALLLLEPDRVDPP